MAPPTNIALMARANQLGIDGYRNMSEADLQAAIKRASKGGAPAKGKTSTNGSVPKGKGKAAVATVTKGKTQRVTPESKSRAASTKNSKATPAKGKTTPAKGKASPAKTAPKGKSTVKASPAKSTAKKSTSAKTKASQGAQAKRTPARGKQPVGAVSLDNKAIDWKAESNVGRTGKRKEVLDALRRYKGDKLKAFNLLAPKAKTFYKGRSKYEAERMLVWLIGRVAFDFAMKTGQHKPGKRAEYGMSDAPQDIRRRAQREEERKEAAKAERAAKRGKK